MRASRWCQSRYWRLEARWLLIRSPRVSYRHLTLPAQVHERGLNNRATKSSFFDFQLPDSDYGEVNETKLPDVCRRAQAYGIPTEAKLALEADVGHSQQIGSRMVDHTANRQDLELWSILLDYRRLKDGIPGVLEVLHGMRFRGDPVKLYTDDLVSDHIFRSLLSMSTNHQEILDGLCNPATGIGRSLPSLFIEVTGYLLRHDSYQEAARIARMLRRSHFRGREDMLALLQIFCDRNDRLTINEFCTIHKSLPYTRIHRDAVRKLLDLDRVQDAWSLHSHLLAHADLPLSFEDIEPFIDDLVRKDQPLEPFIRQLEAANVSFSSQATRTYQQQRVSKLTSSDGDVRLLIDKTSGARPRKLSDEFIARALATTSFSFDFVLNSLRLFGLIEVGPLAVREMALAAGSLEILSQRLAKMEAAEIDFGSSAFVAVVRNLCKSNSGKLLEAVLSSDQHHEVYEDRETQKRLLANYYYQNDWPQVNRTLAILNSGKLGKEAQQRSRNLLLQSAIVVRDWQGALQLLAESYSHEAKMLPDIHESVNVSLNSLVDMILPRDASVRQQKQEYLERGRYLAGVLQEMMSTGIFVSRVHWSRLIFSFGELGQMYDLERLCIWLARHYHSLVKSSEQKPRLSYKYTVVLHELFDVRLQAAILEWFYCVIPANASRAESAMKHAQRGIGLLRRLHTDFEVPLDYGNVKEVYTKRIRSFFTRQEDIDLHTHFFDAIWLNDLSRGLRRNDRKRVRKARYPTYEELQEFSRRSNLKPLSQQLEDQVSDDIVTSKSVTLGDEMGMVPRTADEMNNEVVEYQDLFHPSWKEYRN